MGRTTDWKPQPVISLNLGNIGIKSIESFRAGLANHLRDVSEGHGIDLDIKGQSPSAIFRNLTSFT
jgi:hypothetical protein